MDGLINLSLLVALYFAPFCIAMLRGHPQAGPIGLINIFLGWTGLGWVVALVMAVWNFKRPEKHEGRGELLLDNMVGEPPQKERRD